VKVTVFVSPKATVLDPQGAAVEQAIKSLGHQSVGGVRVGKTITFEMEGEDSPETRTQIDRLCDGLLSNPVIEDYRFEIEAG
jgi:phosphoribosylformylglycinamidine synthase|tara:strand:+ start:1047 stop:1292 length:246 start_codon:yes stop_codon:yes gene_type:complete